MPAASAIVPAVRSQTATQEAAELPKKAPEKPTAAEEKVALYHRSDA
jgi:hypothetical protein